jgi:hypothetical protein
VTVGAGIGTTVQASELRRGCSLGVTVGTGVEVTVVQLQVP